MDNNNNMLNWVCPYPQANKCTHQHATAPYVQKSMPAVSQQTVTPKGCGCSTLQRTMTPPQLTGSETTVDDDGWPWRFFQKKMNLLKIICATTTQTNASPTPKSLCVCAVIRNPMPLVFIIPAMKSMAPAIKDSTSLLSFDTTLLKAKHDSGTLKILAESA